jgi:hypothetical protein
MPITRTSFVPRGSSPFIRLAFVRQQTAMSSLVLGCPGHAAGARDASHPVGSVQAPQGNCPSFHLLQAAILLNVCSLRVRRWNHQGPSVANKPRAGL